MRVIVVGGSGRTGALVVEKLRAAKHEVAATIRNAKHTAALVKQGVEAMLLDLEKSSLAEWTTAFKGADAIVFAAGSGENEPSDLDRKGVFRTVLAAQKAGVRRYVNIASLGASTRVPEEFRSAEMKSYFTAKKSGNKRVRDSGLDWTILEPAELSDDPGLGKITVTEGEDIENRIISREDVAAAVAAVLATPASAGHTFQLRGGGTAIAAAIKKASK